MLYFLKVILKVTSFWPLFLTKLSQKHKIIFLNKMKLGTNPKKLFLHPKSNFTICEKKSTTIANIFKKLWLFFDLSNFPIFGSFALLRLLKSLQKSQKLWCQGSFAILQCFKLSPLEKYKYRGLSEDTDLTHLHPPKKHIPRLDGYYMWHGTSIWHATKSISSFLSLDFRSHWFVK